MSIFVSILAFPPGQAQEMAKAGVFIGSLVSALIGYIILRVTGKWTELGEEFER